MSKMRTAQVVLVLASISLYFLANIRWFEVFATDEFSGDQHLEVSGATVFAALQILPWVFMAGAIATIALRGLWRRLVSVVVVLIAAAALWIPVQVLVAGPEVTQFQQILTTSSSDDAPLLQSWAQVEEVAVITWPVCLVALALAAILVSAVVLGLQRGANAANSSKYATPQSRREALEADLEQDADSGRVLWEALDADIDPTDKR